MTANVQKLIGQLFEGNHLSQSQAYDLMTEIMEGRCTDAQIGAILGVLRVKGESAEEICGFALAMRDKAAPVQAVEGAIDTCGTGGDKQGTFNVSTVAAFVAAGAGVPVAKHGNRSVSSRSGSADVLEELGVRIDVPVSVIETCIREAGIGFLFAPRLHPAMRHVAPVRRELGVRTVFNLLGPLTNPARVKRQVMGVWSRDLLLLIGDVLYKLGVEHAFVLHSQDGLDEISVVAETDVMEVRPEGVTPQVIDPSKFGLQHEDVPGLNVANVKESAERVRAVLSGEKGPAADMVLLNAAAAIYVGGKVLSLGDAIDLARESIETGRAMTALEKIVEITNQTDCSIE